MDKKIQTLPNGESDHLKITDEDVRLSGNNADHQEVTGQRMALSNNPFHLLSDHGKEENSSTIPSDTPQHPLPRDDIHTLNEKSLPPQTNEDIKKDARDSQRPPTPPLHQSQEGDNSKPEIILLMDSNGKFIDPNKFIYNKSVDKYFTPTIASAIETITNKSFDNPSTLVIHTGTNDIEHSTLDYCFENFQTLIELTAQKYPATKIVISSLIARKDSYENKRPQLNNRISRIHPFPNVHFVSNENINQEMLHDSKHIKRRKIGILVTNLKDCIFNRIAQRSNQTFTKEPRNLWSKVTATPATMSIPPLMNAEPVFEAPKQQKSYSEALQSLSPTTDVNQTVLQLLKLYEMIHQH